MPRAASLLAPLASLALLATSCSTPQGPSIAAIAPSINATLLEGEDVIEPGDLLEVRLRTESGREETELFDQSVRVQADGRAAFEGLDVVYVAGLLPSVLGELLTGRYAPLVEGEHTVEIAISERAPRTVTVFGEVARPGVVGLPEGGRPFGLVDALGRVGGPRKRTAWLSNTLLVRWDPTISERRTWTIDARTRHWAAKEEVFLQPGDVVFVPNTNIDRVGLALDSYVRRLIPLPYLAPPRD
ncbi:MAG: hypothetical protein AAF726_15625 [Planctomycetota bacterium]